MFPSICWFRRGVHKQEIVSLLGVQFVQNNSEFGCTVLHGATSPCIKTSEKFVAQGQVDSLDLEPGTDLACLACNELAWAERPIIIRTRVTPKGLSFWLVEHPLSSASFSSTSSHSILSLKKERIFSYDVEHKSTSLSPLSSSDPLIKSLTIMLTVHITFSCSRHQDRAFIWVLIKLRNLGLGPINLRT